MSIEDRVRAATRARTDLVRDIRPLELPDDLPDRAVGRQGGRRRQDWLIPLTAAAAIVAVALTLVIVRQVGTTHPAPVTPARSAAIPRYYAALFNDGVIVGDDRTGKQVADVAPPTGEHFTYLTGAADDRTFVVTALVGRLQPSRLVDFYLLRITPGTAHPYQLTKLNIGSVNGADPVGSLSPDGRELAVLSSAATGLQAQAPAWLRIYSVATGALLRTWTTTKAGLLSLSWLADSRRVVLNEGIIHGGGITDWSERVLEVAGPGGDLLADSHVFFTIPLPDHDPCYTVRVTPDGQSVICGRQYNEDVTSPIAGAVKFTECAKIGPAFIAYSVRTGKPVRVLYQYRGSCAQGWATPVWSDPSGQHVIGILGINPGDPSKPNASPLSNASSLPAVGAKVGVAAGGTFTALRVSEKFLKSVGGSTGFLVGPGIMAF